MKTSDVLDLRERVAKMPDSVPVMYARETLQLIDDLLEARDIAGNAIPRPDDVDRMDAW